MASTLRLIAAFIVLVAGTSSRAQTQPVAPPLSAPQTRLSDAEQKFDTVVRTFEQYLYDAGAFAVNVTSQWTSSGSGKPAQGTNIFHVAVQKGGKFRIEAGSQEKGAAQFVCVSDGRRTTRLYRPARYYSQHDASPTQDELQYDALTLQTVSGSGVELLIRPQIRAADRSNRQCQRDGHGDIGRQ